MDDVDAPQPVNMASFFALAHIVPLAADGGEPVVWIQMDAHSMIPGETYHAFFALRLVAEPSVVKHADVEGFHQPPHHDVCMHANATLRLSLHKPSVPPYDHGGLAPVAKTAS